MNRKKIIAKVIEKLVIKDFLKDLEEVAENPEKVKSLLQDFQTRNNMDQSEKLQLISEIKKKDLIKKEIPGMDKAWRAILKEWNLSHVRIWSY